jgi:hypothetical protein
MTASLIRRDSTRDALIGELLDQRQHFSVQVAIRTGKQGTNGTPPARHTRIDGLYEVEVCRIDERGPW